MASVNLSKLQLSDLRCRVNVNRWTPAQDAIGGVTGTWATLYTVWAYIEAWKGREVYRAERTEGQVYNRVVVRGGLTIQDNDVINFNGRLMPVKYINNFIDGKLKYIEMLAVEQDPIPNESGMPAYSA